MSGKKRNMPTANQIRKYWYKNMYQYFPDYEYIDDLLKKDICFSCGDTETKFSKKNLEKAHIEAKQIGGSDNVSNIHLLCEICHQDSEMVSGQKYWEWFKQRTHADMLLSNYIRSGLGINLFKFMSDYKNENIEELKKIVLIVGEHKKHEQQTRSIKKSNRLYKGID